MIELIITSILMGGVVGWIWHLYDKKTRAKKKREMFDYIEFEKARADNPLIKQLHIDQEKHKRTRHEMDEVFRMSKYCSEIVVRHSKDIPDEDYAEFMLSHELTAYLPLSIKEFLGPFEGLIAMHNPYIGAKIDYI